MLSDDVYRYSLRATIEGLRYWVPSIADLARVAQEETDGFWRLDVSPHVSGACPFELVLRDDKRFDATFAGQSYADVPVTELSLFLPLAEAIVDGRVVQRRWISSQTGARLGIETLIAMPGGTVWRHGTMHDAFHANVWESRDHHFLPYRR